MRLLKLNVKGLIITAVFVTLWSGLASAGVASGGGGDAMTSQFIIMAKQLATFYKENPFQIKLPFAAASFEERVRVLESSLATPDQRHLVEFTDAILFDKNHVEKAAKFEDQVAIDKAQIKVNRKRWAKYNSEQRLTLINLEIFGIMKIKNRYPLASNLIHGHAAVISSIPLPDDSGYHKPGWRIVGQDPDQFGRITDEDFIIDGRALGLGTELNLRVENFLLNPAGDTKWFSGLMEAWTKGRPAFLLANSPGGNNATATAIYPRSDGENAIVSAYSLHLTKFRQIYQGPCAGNASGLTAVERLKNCYLDLSNYSSNDALKEQSMPLDFSFDQMNETLKRLTVSLHGQLLQFYANDGENLSSALRGYFITDYSPTVPQYEIYAKNASVNAFGLVTDFNGPFDQVPFWKQAGKKDIPSIRFYEATKALAMNDLVFLDENIRCDGINGPALVSREMYNNKVRPADSQCISLRMGLQFPDPLYSAMVQLGFYYDYANQKWVYEKKSQKGEQK